jgi:hypothetical protein
MQYVILCIDFPEKMRNNDAIWLKKIYESRDQIAYYMVLMPKINREYLEKTWEDELKTALKFARTEEKVKTEKLTWEQVFEIEYGQIKLENHGKQ